jgi:hypothetical protein
MAIIANWDAPGTWPMEEPQLFRGLQALDRRRFQRGQAHPMAPVLRQ